MLIRFRYKIDEGVTPSTPLTGWIFLYNVPLILLQPKGNDVTRDLLWSHLICLSQKHITL
jgi:hypothetical protein